MPPQPGEPLSLLALLDQSLSRFSGRLAVEDRTRHLTHSKLHARADDFARTLTALHLPQKSVVGLYMDGSVEYIIALLGILKADMIFMPLNTVFPGRRLQAMLEKTAPALLVTDHRFADELRMKTTAEGQHYRPPELLVFPPYPETTDLIVAEGAGELTEQGTGSPFPAAKDVRVGLDDACYILTTSGSTGESKAILGSQAGLAHFIQWETKEFGFNASTRVSLLSPVTFDVSLRDIFAPLSVGGCVCIPDEAIMQNPLMLLQWLRQTKVTVMHIVPTLFRMLINTIRMEDLGREALPSLEHVLLAGEVVHGSDIKQWREVAGRRATLVNLYGPSETTLAKLFHRIVDDRVAAEEIVPIGQPLPDTEVFIVENGQVCAPGQPGEIFIKTPYMSKGYYNDRLLTEKHFIPNPLSGDQAELVYKTGDQGVFLQDGGIRFLGRLDGQVKLHGRRIELEEIETTLRQHQDVQQAAAALKVDSNGISRLVGYLVTAGGKRLTVETLRGFLDDKLPAYMLPQTYVHLATLPLTHSRKIDRNALPEPGRERPDMECPYVPPGNEQEKVLCDIWGRILEVDRVGTQDGFFELGGTSVLAMRMIEVIRKAMQVDLPVVKVFQYPSVALLAEYLQGFHACGVSFADPEQRGRQRRTIIDINPTENPGIAIIGMAGRFPGAQNSAELWRNLCAGVESITFFTEEELDSGIDPRLKNNPAYVRARGVLQDAEGFDAAFFAVPPREAQIMDPQHRVFLETAWEALEDAGYAPGLFQCLTGVFGGAGYNTYFIKNVLTNQNVYQSFGEHQAMLANAPDYLATRVSYKLDLKGPSISLYTGCSSSLVAVSCAFDSLLSYQCDLALAGGVFVSCPQNSGYLYQKGEIFSADGHCRPFDALANGTVFSNGAGIVVLKRLEDALRDKDNIYAVIRGTAVNNDGSQKASFAAPSVAAQAEAVAMAMANANVHPETITYIETLGTGTLLGDPMEIEALTQAFRNKTSATNYCALGSIKGNLGHLDAAAGVVGLIKTALALKNKLIPPSLHFEQVNPEIALSTSPFYVNTELRAWPETSSPRRAGVTALGVGGTNVHVILEEAPEREPSSPSRPAQLLLISAKTASALEAATARLGSFLQQNPPVPLADVAYTLQAGRKGFRYRRFAVCTDLADAVTTLQSPSVAQVQTRVVPAAAADVVFMFPGQGSQYVNMGLDLYNHETVFRQTVDQCAEFLMKFLHQDLREILYPQDKDQEQAAALLCRTSLQQPALFTIEYALAKLWETWGVRPAAMIGHSLGEYVAACLAGVFSLHDALMLVTARGRMMQELPEGSMLSVRLPATEVGPRLEGQLSLAAVNSPSLCVVAGPTPDIERFRHALEQQDVMCRDLKTSHAFHSSMVEAIVEPFAALVKTVALSAPKIPYVSTATGTWITAAQATDPQFWGTQLRRTVHFAQGIEVVLEKSDRVLLEVGPGNTTATLARQQLRDRDRQIVVASLETRMSGLRESTALSYALGQLWLSGAVIDWPAFYQEEQRHRLPLPTYPFERRRHWLDPPALEQHGDSQGAEPAEEHKRIQAGGTVVRQDGLAPQEPEPIEAAAPHEPKRGMIARQMAVIWQDLLGVETVSLQDQDNFFDLGGDSLVAARLMAQVEKHFHTSIGPEDLLAAPTLAGLVDLIYSGQASASPATGEDLPYTVILGNAGAHKQDILALWSRNYPNLTADRFDWLYQGNPYGSATCLFVKHRKTEQLVGVHAVFPRRVFIRGQPFLAGLGGDLAIDKKHRILAPALLLQNTVLSECSTGALDLFYGFPNNQSQAVNTMLGLQMLDVVRMTRPLKSQYYIQRCLRSQTISKTLAKTIDSITRRLARETRYKRSAQHGVAILSGFDERFDTLWQEASAQFTIIGERTRAYLEWRYRRSPHHHHAIFALSDTSTNALLGYIIFHTDDHTTYIDDMLCGDMEKDFDAVLAEFLLLQRENDMETVSISFAGSRRFMKKLHAFGFFARDKEDKVTVYAAPERDYQPILMEADNWYLMPGDKDI